MPAEGGTHPTLADSVHTDAPSRLLTWALLLACVIHLVLIGAVSFVFPKKDAHDQATRQLEIMVLRQATPSDKKPEIADAFAQIDREGGGVEKPPEAQIEPVPEIGEPELVPALAPPPLLDAAPPALRPPREPKLLAQSELEPEPTPLLETEPPTEPPPEPEPPQATAAEILESRNLEIAELTARIQHSSAAYANRARRKAISASTREYKYASYLEAWRRKVERVGNLNYPEEAKRHKMYGSLILHVAVRADGSIESLRVVRSSGVDLLDEAAIKIVELAAPFAPFPPDISAETDILDITRTWQFLRSNRLGWEK